MQNRKDALSPIALVQPDKKCLPYTVVPIGGLEALITHRIAVDYRETQYQREKAAKDAVVRLKAVQMVEEQVSTVKFTQAEREEIQTLIKKREQAAIEGRMEHQKASYDAYLKHDNDHERLQQEYSKTFLQKCKERLSRVWRDAFDNS